MTAYLLKSSLGLLVALLFYKAVLENERMHGFKRFFLLGSLLFAALMPLVSLEVASRAVWLTAIPPELVSGPELPAGLPMAAPAALEIATPTSWSWLLGGYGLVAVLLLGRFGRNLYRMARQIIDNPKRAFRGAILVRLSMGSLPYTFLRYLFVPAAAYERGEMEEELFTHELAHVRQRHSLDILLIELLLCLAWFNPLLYWYRRAMQLNHEFLADEAVVSRCHDVPRYQRLLLSKLPAAPPPLPLLASALLFQTTKQRLLMMTKHTSRRTTWLASSATTLLLGALTLLLGTTAAQIAPPTRETSALAKTPRLAATAAPDTLLQRYGDKLVTLYGGQRKKYADLTAEERKLVWVVPLSPRRTPTEAQWADWHNPRKFGIWVDGKRLRGNALSAYQRTDIVEFSGSYVHKNARQPEGYLYQMDLTTEKGYAEEVRRHQESPFLILRQDQPKK